MTVKRLPEYFIVDFYDAETGGDKKTILEPRISADISEDVQFYMQSYTQLGKHRIHIALAQLIVGTEPTVVYLT